MTYNGTAQELVSAGSTNGGEMQYALQKASEASAALSYSTNIPTATDAGSYYVWYKVAEGANYHEVGEQKATVTIAKKTATINTTG